eukprot:9871928-Ditylum_brightwellii.AAC.1
MQMVGYKAEYLKDEIEEKKEASCASVLFKQEYQKCDTHGAYKWDITCINPGKYCIAYSNCYSWGRDSKLIPFDYVQQFHPILRIIGETLAAYCLGRVATWEQLFTDDETSECHCKEVLKMIGTAGQQLEQRKEVIGTMYPDYVHGIPDASLMDIGKLGESGAITTDTFNSACKTRCILADAVRLSAEEMRVISSDGSKDVNTIEADYWNHLRNMWLGGFIKSP